MNASRCDRNGTCGVVDFDRSPSGSRLCEPRAPPRQARACRGSPSPPGSARDRAGLRPAGRFASGSASDSASAAGDGSPRANQLIPQLREPMRGPCSLPCTCRVRNRCSVSLYATVRLVAELRERRGRHRMRPAVAHDERGRRADQRELRDARRLATPPNATPIAPPIDQPRMVSGAGSFGEGLRQQRDRCRRARAERAAPNGRGRADPPRARDDAAQCRQNRREQPASADRTRAATEAAGLHSPIQRESAAGSPSTRFLAAISNKRGEQSIDTVVGVRG